MARLVASKLTRDELIELSELLDQDGGDEFNTCIQAETCKVAPELYNAADEHGQGMGGYPPVLGG